MSDKIKDDFSKTVVTISYVLLILYTIAVLIIFERTGLEPEVLTRYFVGAIVGEFGFLSGIKIIKEIKSSKKRGEQADETYHNVES